MVSSQDGSTESPEIRSSGSVMADGEVGVDKSTSSLEIESRTSGDKSTESRVGESEVVEGGSRSIQRIAEKGGSCN